MTLISKMCMAITFIVPMLMFEFTIAIIASVAWGLVVITVLSYFLAKKQGEKSLNVIGEHLTIAVAVIIATHYVGDWVAAYFG